MLLVYVALVVPVLTDFRAVMGDEACHADPGFAMGRGERTDQHGLGASARRGSVFKFAALGVVGGGDRVLGKIALQNEPHRVPRPPEQSQPWIWLGLMFLWLALVVYMWSPKYYWPDADGYLLHVAEGRWVAHPPGYALFVILGRIFHAFGFASYFSVQLASLSLTVAGLFVLYRLMRQVSDPLRAKFLTAAAAFSWLVLLNVQTGTSHASDLFTVSLLLLSAVKLPASRSNAWGPDFFFASALFLCAGFRLTTFLMMGPLCLLVAWNNRARPSFWMACFFALTAVAFWQLWVIGQSGGYAAYSAAAAAMNADNRPSSVLLSGLTETTLLNVIRALLWGMLGTLPFLVVIANCARFLVRGPVRIALSYGVVAMTVPLAAVSLYLCTHPGYVLSVVPGAALTAAVLLSDTPARFPAKSYAGAALVVVAMFLFMMPVSPPATKWQAVANGILLQYSAGCSRQAVFNTTARWLQLGGLESEIPSHRVIDLRQEDDWREHFEKVGPR